MKPKQQVIAKCLGGSHMYGLATEKSDIDVRGVFLNLDLRTVIGFGRHDHQDLRMEGEEDFFMQEFRQYIASLKKTNTQALELLFNDKWEICHPIFALVRHYKSRLMDSERLFVSLTGGEKAGREQGYIGNEMRLAFGERTGKLGSQRKNALDDYGYSYKNVVQLLRLCACGKEFFQSGVFPTDIRAWDNNFVKELLGIKVNPQKYNVAELREIIEDAKLGLFDSYDNRRIHFEFDDELADLLCLAAYRPFLSGAFGGDPLHELDVDLYSKDVLGKSINYR